MNRQEAADKWYDTIFQLYGADEFKEKVRRLRVFQHNKVKYSASGIRIPNYFWIARRGGGISTCINAFAEYLYAENIIEFNGIVKYFEFKLGYMGPGDFFSELTRLHNTISEIAGHHRYFKGLACIHIDEWQDHINEDNFYKVLDYLAIKNDTVKTIFCIDSDDNRVIEKIESSISSRLRIERVTFRFPEICELVSFIETKYFQRQGFSLTEDARGLLGESIGAISTGKNFNGFVTVKHLAKDVLYHLLMSEVKSRSISADMLGSFAKDSAHINKLKSFVGTKSVIGFSSGAEEYSR